MARVSLPAPGAGHRRYGAIISAAAAATAALFDEVREEHDSARHCLTTALDDFHKVMAALDAEPAAAITERDTLRGTRKDPDHRHFKFDRRPP